MLSEIGLIGLGVMGKNIALNIAEKGTFVKAFNGSRSKIDLVGKEFDGMFAGFTDLEDLVNNLERPRNILLMIPSGQPTHSVINQLSKLLDEGDVIIDGGNSFYKESVNHGNILSSQSVNFIKYHYFIRTNVYLFKNTFNSTYVHLRNSGCCINYMY